MFCFMPAESMLDSDFERQKGSYMKQEEDKADTAPEQDTSADQAEEIAEAVELSYGLRVLGVRPDPGQHRQHQPGSPEPSTSNASAGRGAGTPTKR
jgi:hypothetical protein